MNDTDTKGDVYEYMLSKIATAGTNGQFRTPRHIIKMMVELVQPHQKISSVILLLELADFWWLVQNISRRITLKNSKTTSPNPFPKPNVYGNGSSILP